MNKNWSTVPLSLITKEINIKSSENNQFPAITSSLSGIYIQTDYFKKTVASANNIGYKIISPGQFTYRSMSDDGVFKINRYKFSHKGIVSPAYSVFEVINADASFIEHLFGAHVFSSKLYKIIQGGTRLALKYKVLKKIQLELPPIHEQKKIASILNSVDNLIKNTQLQIEKLQYLKKGMVNKLLIKGISHTEFKDSKLGRIPKSWEIMTLEKIGNFSRGKGISKKDTVNSGVPCIRYAEIYTNHNILIKKFYSYISKETAKKSIPIKKNDIIFAGSGENIEEIGKSVAFVDTIEAYAGGDTILFSPKINIDSIFFAYQLNDDFRRIQFRKFGQGSSVFHIYSSELKKVLVVFPTLEEQFKISSIILKFENRVKMLKNKLLKYKLIKKSLMQDLLTGKVSVTIN